MLGGKRDHYCKDDYRKRIFFRLVITINLFAVLFLFFFVVFCFCLKRGDRKGKMFLVVSTALGILK